VPLPLGSGDKAASPHPRSRLTQLPCAPQDQGPLCVTRPGAFVRYKTHCDRKAHNRFLFIEVVRNSVLLLPSLTGIYVRISDE
jgi:hypothetical protein